MWQITRYQHIISLLYVNLAIYLFISQHIAVSTMTCETAFMLNEKVPNELNYSLKVIALKDGKLLSIPRFSKKPIEITPKNVNKL
tara:strand:- start:58557 stop:58811 length:255 start_codon:yes stop_codon:yes gene_type:complete